MPRGDVLLPKQWMIAIITLVLLGILYVRVDTREKAGRYFPHATQEALYAARTMTHVVPSPMPTITPLPDGYAVLDDGATGVGWTEHDTSITLEPGTLIVVDGSVVKNASGTRCMITLKEGLARVWVDCHTSIQRNT